MFHSVKCMTTFIGQFDDKPTRGQSSGVRTLRTQDTSDPLVPKCPRDTSAPLPKCLGHFGTINTFYDEKSDYHRHHHLFVKTSTMTAN